MVNLYVILEYIIEIKKQVLFCLVNMYKTATRMLLISTIKWGIRKGQVTKTKLYTKHKNCSKSKCK